jgi:hypothetical protein
MKIHLSNVKNAGYTFGGSIHAIRRAVGKEPDSVDLLHARRLATY